MKLLMLVSWPYARKHLLRTMLTMLGIVLGVAVFVGMHSANQSVLDAFSRTVNKIAGKAQLQVSAGETGFDEDILEKVQAVPEVAVAVPVLEAVVSTQRKGQGNLMILGVDMTGDRTLRDYDLEGGKESDTVDDPLIFLAQADSLIVSRKFADRNGLAMNKKMTMKTMDGDKDFTIRGLMGSGGLASAFDGNLGVMDIYAAQKVFGRGRKFDRIDIALKEGVKIDAGKAAIEAALGTGFQVAPPSARSKQFESMLAGYTTSMNISSAFALFVGMFIIYNSFSIAVTQRRAEIGILRAVGATRRQIQTIFLSESAIVGLIGSAIGMACGIALAYGLADYIGDIMQGAYGISEKPRPLIWGPELVAIAVAIGTGTSVIASFIPARTATQVDPVQALQKGKSQVLSAGDSRIRRIIAFALGVVCLVCIALGANKWVFYAGYIFLVIATLLLAPSLSMWIAQALRPFLRWIRPVEGSLAVDSLLQAPRRTSATVSALMLCLAMVVGLAGTSLAALSAVQEWLKAGLNADMFVSTSEDLNAHSFRFPPEMAGQLQQLPGVDEVQAVRNTKVMFHGTQVSLTSFDVDRTADRSRGIKMMKGVKNAYSLAHLGKAVLISGNLGELQHLKVGDEVEVAAPYGTMKLPIAGIIQDFADQQGSIFVDRTIYQQYWKDTSVDMFKVYLKPGSDPPAVKAEILERFSSQRRLFVYLNKELRSYVLKLTEQWFGITYIQLALALVVAVLGIVNSLTVSITDRKRELGILRAVGGVRGQVRGAIWMEALTIGAVGLIMGIGLGAINLYYQLELMRRDFNGIPLEYSFPWMVALGLVPLILITAFIAAIGPGEASVRGSLVEALAYE
jgi:putative ABC transport system permease protein